MAKGLCLPEFLSPGGAASIGSLSVRPGEGKACEAAVVCGLVWDKTGEAPEQASREEGRKAVERPRPSPAGAVRGGGESV